MLGPQLLSQHNVHFYLNMIKQIRIAIKEDRFIQFKDDFLKKYKGR